MIKSTSTSCITFQPVTAANWRATLDLAVHPEQQRFVADYVPITAIALAKAYVRPGNYEWKPFAILDGEQMIGFIELAFMSATEDEYWIFHFFIDYRYQKQGYGYRSLHFFLRFVQEQYPRCRQLNLQVHPENTRAQHVYEQVGFRLTGRLIDGEPMYTYQLPEFVA